MKAPPIDDSTRTVGEGRWVPLQVIGEGGQCQVVAVWDVRLRMGRALKVLLPEPAQSRKLRARFVQEAETQRRLIHPHIVRVYEVFPDAELPWMVMELVEGGSLQDWVDRHGPMPPRLAAQAILDAAQGLQAAHAEALVHRDVKPANLLVHSNGRCKVADFGIARDPTKGLTRTGAVFGTLGYIAPEQLEDASSVDARADVYGLAASLFALLAMPTHMEQMRLADDRELLDKVPAPLRSLLFDALRGAPAQRTPTMEAFAASLDEALSALPPDPTHPPLALPSALDGPLDARVVRELFDPIAVEAPPELAPVQPNREPRDPDLPSYVVEQEPRSDRLPTPPPPPPRPPPPPPRPSLAPMVLGALVVLALVAGGVSSMAVGSRRVHDAWSAHAVAADQLQLALEADAVVVDELEALGFDVGPARATLQHWRDEPGPVTTHEAIRALSEAARPLLVSSPERPDAVQARQRLDRILEAREREQLTARAWSAEASSGHGWLPATLGMAPSP